MKEFKISQSTRGLRILLGAWAVFLPVQLLRAQDATNADANPSTPPTVNQPTEVAPSSDVAAPVNTTTNADATVNASTAAPKAANKDQAAKKKPMKKAKAMAAKAKRPEPEKKPDTPPTDSAPKLAQNEADPNKNIELPPEEDLKTLETNPAPSAQMTPTVAPTNAAPPPPTNEQNPAAVPEKPADAQQIIAPAPTPAVTNAPANAENPAGSKLKRPTIAKPKPPPIKEPVVDEPAQKSAGTAAPATKPTPPVTVKAQPATGDPAADLDEDSDDIDVKVEKPTGDKVGADLVPDGQELVNIDFPEPTEIKDIIRAVSLWTGKNVILGRDVSGKVQMISPRKVTKVEAYQAFLSALNLLGLTTVETGKVIKIVPVRSAVKSNLKTFLGSSWTPMTDELITQIVPLKYVNAKNIQTTLSRIVSSNSMIPYEPTNTLIISDSGYKVRRILDIIQMLDVQTQQPKLSIVPIRYGDAKSIQQMVQNIFNEQSKGKAGSSSYLTYKIMTDERTNSVIIFGPPRTIADVKALVKKFDVRVDDPARQSQIHVRPLDYADATKLASTLSSLASGGKAKTTPRRPQISSSPPGSPPIPSGGGDEAPPVASLDNDVKITSDESSNSLLITGSRAAYDAVNAIVRKLDIRKSQVFVEAEILDIKLDGGFLFKSSIFAGAGKEKGTKVAYTWEAEGLSPLIEAQAAQNANNNTTTNTAIGRAAGAFKDDLTIGILSGTEVNVPGLGKISPGALIKMIKTDSYTRVLSSPHILTANNEQSKFTVGDKLFYRTSEISTSGTAIEKVNHEDVDLSLDLKPNISHSNYITMKIDLDATTGQIDSQSRLPSVLKRKTSQIVTVKNGQTVVISGLVKTEEYEVYSKIPLLGDIPILGWLFRNSEMQKKNSNLMIFLTPHIIHGANDLAAIYARKVDERDEFFDKAYGSTYKDDDFYKMLPQKEDGQFRADAFDMIDQRNRKARRHGMMRDMGYTDKEIQQIEKGNLEQSESAKDLPLRLPSDEAQPNEPAQPIPQPEPELNKDEDDGPAATDEGEDVGAVDVDGKEKSGSMFIN